MVRLIDILDMTIVVDWYLKGKSQIKQIMVFPCAFHTFVYMLIGFHC